MKPTKKDIQIFRDEVQQKIVQEFEKEFGPIEEIKKQYTESEWRVLTMSLCFEGVPEALEQAEIALDMLQDKWADFIELKEYMASGDWQMDYEAEERGELRKDIPKGVLSQDELYNSLMRLGDIMKNIRRVARHSRAKEAKK